MRHLYAYVSEAIYRLDTLSIRYAADLQFTVNQRLQTRLGVCKKAGDRYTIEIAAFLLDETYPEVLLQETLLHELLHTCDGCMQHTGQWKTLAERVNAAYGLQIARLTNMDRMPSAPKQHPSYRVVCRHCGTVFERYKRSPLIQHPERYRCGKCRQPLG